MARNITAELNRSHTRDYSEEIKASVPALRGSLLFASVNCVATRCKASVNCAVRCIPELRFFCTVVVYCLCVKPLCCCSVVTIPIDIAPKFPLLSLNCVHPITPLPYCLPFFSSICVLYLFLYDLIPYIPPILNC